MTTNKKNDKEGGGPSLFDRYNRALESHPLLVNGLQAAVIAGLGVLASQFISGLKHFDWLEIRVVMLLNFAFNTPVLLAFYGYLNEAFSSNISKLVIDQFCFSPVFNAAFIGLRLYLLGTSHVEIPGILYAVLPKAITTAWMFWLPTRFFIISLTPPTLQLLFGSMAGFVWNIIFSMVLNG